MNVASREYWNSFWKGKENEPEVSSCQFGEDVDTLARLVVNSIKLQLVPLIYYMK